MSSSKVEETTTTAASPSAAPAKPAFNPQWQQTMLRIKDPKVEIPFWETHFGFKLVARFDEPEENMSYYFMGTVPEGVTIPKDVTSKEAQQQCMRWNGNLLELAHKYGTEDMEGEVYVNGNVEPNRGFGHVAVMCKDVYASCEVLEKAGVAFKKKPNEGRMKGLAFALSPTGYWIEVIRGEVENFTLAQTMIRVKDPAKSVAFYRDLFGMSLVASKDFPAAKFSLYFMASIPEGEAPPSSMSTWDGCVLELTHNHGTEDDPEFSYDNGNKSAKGFGHIGFLVDDVAAFSAGLEKAGVPFQRKPTKEATAFALDPDNYWVEILPRSS